MYSVGGDTDILKLQHTKRGRISYWKDVGQLTEKAGTKLEISTIDCNLVHNYIEDTTEEDTTAEDTTEENTTAEDTSNQGEQAD